jgi:hypothetical protein
MFMIIHEKRRSWIIVSVLLALAVFLSVPVYADENLIYMNQSGLNSTQQGGIYQNSSENSSLSIITIEPVTDHYVGDSFVLRGKANVSPGEEIYISIDPVVLPELNYLLVGYRGSTKTYGMRTAVQAWNGKNSNMEWTCPVHTIDWEAESYLISVRPVNPKYGYARATALFNLTERQSLTPSVHAENTTTSPTPLQNSPQATAAPTGKVPTTRASLPPTVSVTAAGLGIITLHGFRRR